MFRIHVSAASVLSAMQPSTQLVHVFSAPAGYLKEDVRRGARIAAIKPHGLLPVSAAFLVEGGVSAVAALASATVLAAAAGGLEDSKGRLRAAV